MKVEISQETYTNYGLIMFYFRSSGYLPVTLQKEGSKLDLKFSPIYLICWWIFGGFFIFMTYWGMVLDSKSNSISLKLEADTDKIMLLMQATQYCAIFFVGSFINPCRLRKLFDYIQCINKIDSIINTTYKKSEKFKLFLVPTLIIIYNALFSTFYLYGCYQIFGAKLGFIEVIKRYAGVNIVGYFSWVSQYMNMVLLKTLEERIKKLNSILKLEYDALEGKSFEGEQKKDGRFVRRATKVIIRKATLARICNSKEGTIAKLNKVYMKIMESADILNDFLDLSFLITTAAVFWALIYVLYFMMLNVTHARGETARLTALVSICVQLCGHTSRALLIINPAYACLLQVERTKTLVCKLLACNVSQEYRRQIDSLATILGLRELQFSACGFLIVDRLLFTSLVDTITTILMVLFQYRSTLQIGF